MRTFELSGDDGTRWRVTASARLPASSDDPPICVECLPQGARDWQVVSLSVHWRSWLAARASDWPPEPVDAVHWSAGSLCIDYESRWDPHRRAAPSKWQLDAHAKWRAAFDPRSGRWRLRRLRLVGEAEPATR